MTRKSRREIERTLDDMGDDGDGSLVLIVHEDPETGEWYADADLEGDPLDKDSVDPAMVLVEEVVETGWSAE